MTKTGLRLNLGSRDRAIPGFLNMDCDPHLGVDLVADVDRLPFKDGDADEIYSSHILEHFPHTETVRVLKEWHRVLAPGGVLYVAVPDFAKTMEIVQKIGGLNDWAVNFLWGDQGYKTAFHYAGFDENRLRGLLLKAGFSEASRAETFPYQTEPLDCSWLAVEGKRVSLNMVAVK